MFQQNPVPPPHPQGETQEGLDCCGGDDGRPGAYWKPARHCSPAEAGGGSGARWALQRGVGGWCGRALGSKPGDGRQPGGRVGGWRRHQGWSLTRIRGWTPQGSAHSSQAAGPDLTGPQGGPPPPLPASFPGLCSDPGGPCTPTRGCLLAPGGRACCSPACLPRASSFPAGSCSCGHRAS